MDGRSGMFEADRQFRCIVGYANSRQALATAIERDIDETTARPRPTRSLPASPPARHTGGPSSRASM